MSFLHMLLKMSFVTVSGTVTQYNQLGLHEMEPRPFEAMFVMLYYLEGELYSVKDAGTSRLSTMSFLHMLLKMSFVTVSGTVAFMA
jgi:hypothetical protein